MSAVDASDVSRVGHPRGLSTLFFTEMWERFSFYGMRAIFVPFMELASNQGGLGYGSERSGSVLAVYAAAVYMMALPGGWVADRFLGQKRAVFIGGLIIMLGHILLALPSEPTFYAGLGCLVMGTGFLKPNVSSLVGQLYTKDDARRDSGFSIFYMGINIGAFAAPIICAWLAHDDGFKQTLASLGIDPHYAWHLAFGAAAVGMAFGITQFWLGRRSLEGIGDPPKIPAAERRRDLAILAAIVAALIAVPATFVILGESDVALTEKLISNIFGVILLTVFVSTFVVLYVRAASPKDKKGILAMAALALGSVAFFGLFEQAAGVMNAFADERTSTVAFGNEFPAEWFQSVNSVFIMLLSPVFAWMFVWVVRKGIPFNDIRKFAAALVFMGVAFAIMLPVAGDTGVSPWYLVGFYFFSTVAELLLSPVGLSSMSKLAPPSAAGLVMGVWFLSTSNGEWIAGKAHALTADVSETTLFTIVIVGAALVALLLAALGWYFTHRVPLESLHHGHGEEEGSAVVHASQARPITGYGIAALATAAALWPVALTDAALGLAICCILGPSVVILALRGVAECHRGDRAAGKPRTVGGFYLTVASFPVVAGATVFALVGVL